MSEYQVLFINSYQRSGSTSPGMMLGQHPEISYLGEVRNVHEYLSDGKSDYFGDLLAGCPFWRKVFSQISKEPVKLKTKVCSSPDYISRIMMFLARHSSTPKFVNALVFMSSSVAEQRDAYANIRRYYQAAGSAAATPWLVDSSHRTSEARDYVQVQGEKMRAIFLTLDGRGGVNSVMRRAGAFAERASKQWKKFVLGALRFRRQLPNSQILHAKYEDLCMNREHELNRIAEFLNVESFKGAGSLKDASLHFIGGSSTLRVNDNAPLDIKPDEVLRTSTTEEDMAIFEHIGGSINRRLGYGE